MALGGRAVVEGKDPITEDMVVMVGWAVLTVFAVVAVVAVLAVVMALCISPMTPCGGALVAPFDLSSGRAPTDVTFGAIEPPALASGVPDG